MKGQIEIFSNIFKIHLEDAGNILDIRPLGGGCISDSFKITAENNSYFIKSNTPEKADMFVKEKQGLEMLARAGKLHIPQVLGSGIMESISYILLEYIEPANRSDNYWEDFANSLSQLHRISFSQHGLDYDNYIGVLPQINKRADKWTTFFIESRLLPQIDLAGRENKIPNSVLLKFDLLCKKLDQLMPEEKPALLHGDLWSGNFMVNKFGKVTLIVPAVYFGSREAELAFTKLFGGFEGTFYKYYEENFPLEPGFDDRTDLYNLYPLLVHFNMFGGNYLNSAERILKRYTD